MPKILGHEYFFSISKLVLSRIQLNYQKVDTEKHIIYNYFIEVKRLYYCTQATLDHLYFIYFIMLTTSKWVFIAMGYLFQDILKYENDTDKHWRRRIYRTWNKFNTSKS